MDIKVEGGQTLSGKIVPSGSKNAAVALLPASLIFEKEVTFENVPDISDINRLVDILEKFGSYINWDKKNCIMRVDNSKLSFKNLDKNDLGNMKGTSLLWGPMLTRFGKVEFDDLPGGCTLGIRRLDAHYNAFKDLGVKVEETPNSVKMDARRAVGREIWLTEMSVTATENVVLLALGIKGTTRIIGAASEPHVQDLCNFLVTCGAEINGIGSSILEIVGGRKMKPTRYKIVSDHHEITTFLAMGAATGGEIFVDDVPLHIMKNAINIFKIFGVAVEKKDNGLIVKKNQMIEVIGNGKYFSEIKAQPWPGLPVDSLPLFIPLALAAQKGQVMFHNWMYESGLFWTSELTKLGANIILADPHRVIVTSGNKLRGATLEAPYIIRAVVAMVMSAMVSSGESTILNADALYRGHPKFAENLKKIGAKVEIVN